MMQCFTCDVTVSDWRHGDVALEKHLHHFPDCAFARNAYSGPQQHPTDTPASAPVANDDDQITTQPIQETLRTALSIVIMTIVLINKQRNHLSINCNNLNLK